MSQIMTNFVTLNVTVDSSIQNLDKKYKQHEQQNSSPR